MSDKPSGFKIGKPKGPREGKWESIIERNLKQTVYPSRGRIFGSNAGLCERQTSGMILLPDDHEAELSATTQFYFSVGSTYEELVKTALEKEGILIQDEYSIRKTVSKTEVSGRIDFVVRDGSRADDNLILVELKTCGALPKVPKHHHLAQLQTYMLLTGSKKGLLWYISRSVSDYTGRLTQTVFEIEPSEDDFLRVATSMVRGAVFAEHGKLPPIPDHMRKYKCGFCALVPYCWEDARVGLRDMEADIDDMDKLLDISNGLVDQLIANQAEFRTNFLESLGVTSASGKT